ncbi:ATP-binding cassette domain-containing protein [Streptomyces sp. NPDC056656]|uniref:ATP-binding cassette domain-containing protein n=1 Tax=Streptomyces sp. NPDC056656 TaxID=3345895 RepID=UPI0036A1408D
MDPRMRVGETLREPLVIQGVGSRAEQEAQIDGLLDAVGLPRGAVHRYRHEFSGGQRQRLLLARALTLSPDLVVADEPVSALDVSVQTQVLNLMRELQRERGHSRRTSAPRSNRRSRRRAEPATRWPVTFRRRCRRKRPPSRCDLRRCQLWG